MAESKQIAESMATLARAPYGAKFYKVDFHVHTPASTDARGDSAYKFSYDHSYPTSGRGWARIEREREVQAEVYKHARVVARNMVDKFIAEGVSMIAITDHNALGTIWLDPRARGEKVLDLSAPTWYELVDDAATEASEDAGEPLLRVLPGVEISTSGIHVLALFPPTNPRRKIHFEICDLLTHMGFAAEDFGNNAKVGDASPREAVELIHAKGGLAILAHVDGNDKAYFKLHELGSGESKAVLTYPNLHAIEMVKASRMQRLPKALESKYKAKYKSLHHWMSTIRADAGLDGLAVVQGSDAHGYDKIGDRCAYLMMSSPSFESVRAAVLSPASRVRAGDQKLYRARKDGFYVYGVEIDHPRFGRQCLRFNRHLNCVVGAMDSGKSLLFDLMAKAIDEGSAVDGGSKLYVERRLGDESSYYCFTRSGGAVELHALEPKSTGGFSATRVADDHADYHALRPTFFNTGRMDQLLESRDELHAFLVKHFGASPERAKAKVARVFDLPAFLDGDPDPLLALAIDKQGRYSLRVNVNWRRAKKAKMVSFSSRTPSLRRLMILAIVLVCGDNEPIIIDEPAGHFDNEDISNYLVPLIKQFKGTRQFLFATRNATLAVTSDPENYVVLSPTGKTVELHSGFAIDEPDQRENVIALIEGGRVSFHKRALRYEEAAQ